MLVYIQNKNLLKINCNGAALCMRGQLVRSLIRLFVLGLASLLSAFSKKNLSDRVCAWDEERNLYRPAI
jgi:hypothetical protein